MTTALIFHDNCTDNEENTESCAEHRPYIQNNTAVCNKAKECSYQIEYRRHNRTRSAISRCRTNDTSDEHTE